jgi:hypothetical protein
MDNLSIHSLSCRYEAFPPPEAHRNARRFEVHYTPKHGSWLDVAEILPSTLRMAGNLRRRNARPAHRVRSGEERRRRTIEASCPLVRASPAGVFLSLSRPERRSIRARHPSPGWRRELAHRSSAPWLPRGDDEAAWIERERRPAASSGRACYRSGRGFEPGDGLPLRIRERRSQAGYGASKTCGGSPRSASARKTRQVAVQLPGSGGASSPQVAVPSSETNGASSRSCRGRCALRSRARARSRG